MDGRGNASAEIDEGGGVAGVHGNDLGLTEQTAEDGGFAHALAGNGNDAHGGGLGVDHADGHFVGNEAGNGGRRSVAGNGDHVEAHGADAGHGFELLHGEGSAVGSSFDARVFGNGNECAGETAHMGGSEHTALLYGVVEHGEHGGGAGSTDGGEAHALEYFTHGVAHGRRGGEGEVGHAEGNVHASSHFLADEFTYAGYLVGRGLDDFGHVAERKIFMGFLGSVDGLFHHAGTGDAHVDDHVGLADAEIGAGHEGHVLRNVGEHHELGAAYAVAIFGGVGHLDDLAAHESHGVHVDAGLGGSHVDGGTDAVGGGERFGQGVDERAVTGGHALFDQGAETSEKVDARLLGGFVKHLAGAHHLVGVEACADDGHGTDADALVHHGNAVSCAHFVAVFHQVGGIFGYFGAYLVGEHVEVVADAVEEADAEGDGANIEMFVAEHVDSAEHFAFSKHGADL